MTKDRNSRALLLGLAVTLLVVGTCFLAYPPGSAIYDEVGGRKLAIIGWREVPLTTTILHVLIATARLSALPGLLFLLGRQRQSGQPVRMAWLLYLTWGLLLVGWLLFSDWYLPASTD